MIKLSKRQTEIPIEDTMRLADTEFPIELLPLDQKEFLKMMSPFRRRKNAFNPVTKQMDLQTYFDDDNPKYQQAIDDLMDKHIRNFKGISLDGETELDGTNRENKLLLCSVKVEDIEEIPMEDPETKEKAVIHQKRERFFSALILDKLFELAKVRAEVATKN
jgi:hypothetical protein